jgi:hypothetical protein
MLVCARAPQELRPRIPLWGEDAWAPSFRRNGEKAQRPFHATQPKEQLCSCHGKLRSKNQDTCVTGRASSATWITGPSASCCWSCLQFFTAFSHFLGATFRGGASFFRKITVRPSLPTLATSRYIDEWFTALAVGPAQTVASSETILTCAGLLCPWRTALERA